MLKVTVYDQSGKKLSGEKLDEVFFGQKVNPLLIKQAVLTEQSARRKPVAHVKTRGEVRGGGRKPWRQKGTGRARVGSIRSPLWRGGGKTFGPRNIRNYHIKMNKKAKRKALWMVLSDKVQKNKIILLDELKLAKAKAKEFLVILSKLPVKNDVLIVLPRKDNLILRATHNIPNIHTTLAYNLKVFDVLSADFLLMPRESLEIIKKTYVVK